MQLKTATKTPATDKPKIALRQEYKEPCTTPQSDKESNTRRTPSKNFRKPEELTKPVGDSLEVPYYLYPPDPLEILLNPNSKYRFWSFGHIHIPLRPASDSCAILLW